MDCTLPVGQIRACGMPPIIGAGRRSTARRSATRKGDRTMYGTIYRCRPRSGKGEVVEEVARRWLRERAPGLDGFVAYYMLRSETRPGELLGLAVFDSKANYVKYADDPDQHRWFDEFRAALDADIEWNDGEIVAPESATVPL
jgi:quinol monooxygenase YgiN